MKKGNGIRLIVWGSICAMLLFLGGTGYFSFNNGYGKVGSIIKYTKPLVETFNNLNEVKRFNEAFINIKARTDNNKIIVNYDTDATAASYTFNYELMGSERIITTNYTANSLDEQTATLIIRFMIEAVSVLNGYKEGDVFDTFTLSDFESTALIDGVNITKSNSTVTVRINIGKSILNADIKKEENDTEYINQNDLNNMMTSLTENKIYLTSKNGILVKIMEKENMYTIYAQDSSLQYSSVLYESIKTIIRTLIGEDAHDIFVEKYPSISTSFTFDNFTITVGTINEVDLNEFESKNSVIQIDIITKPNQ